MYSPPPKLSIIIPRHDMTSIEGRIKLYKDTLVYLETPVCRSVLTEPQRRLAVKEATENFRAALRMRDSGTCILGPEDARTCSLGPGDARTYSLGPGDARTYSLSPGDAGTFASVDLDPLYL